MCRRSLVEGRVHTSQRITVACVASSQTDTVSSSGLSSKPGAGVDFAARRTHASSLFERPASLSAKAGWRAGGASNLVTNGLLVDILGKRVVQQSSYNSPFFALAHVRRVFMGYT